MGFGEYEKAFKENQNKKEKRQNLLRLLSLDFSNCGIKININYIE